MRTVALRFAESFAPKCGTINAHQELLETNGYVWYGKLGSPLSRNIADEIMGSDDPVILLIHSGSQDRWWAHIERIQREVPPVGEIPAYYRDKTNNFRCWFKVWLFEPAARNVMSKCTVVSSGKTLSAASKHSMSPYFIIDYADK